MKKNRTASRKQNLLVLIKKRVYLFNQLTSNTARQLQLVVTAPPSLLVVTARYRSRSLPLVSTLTMNECKYHQPGGFSKYSRACIYEKSVRRVMKSGGCLCDNWKPKFLLLLIFDWRTFSKRVTAGWRRHTPSVKNQVSTNQNSDWSTQVVSHRPRNTVRCTKVLGA